MGEQIAHYIPKDEVFFEEEKDRLWDMIIVDENQEILKEIHQKRLQVPTIFLCRENKDVDEANFVITKPLVLDSFLNLLQSIVNIYGNSQEAFLSFNQYELRPSHKEILNERNGEITKLTEKEVSILKYLYKTQNKIVSKNELLQEVWGYSPDVTTHTIETHIYRLRQKVEHDDASAQLILTSEGGYQLKI